MCISRPCTFYAVDNASNHSNEALNIMPRTNGIVVLSDVKYQINEVFSTCLPCGKAATYFLFSRRQKADLLELGSAPLFC